MSTPGSFNLDGTAENAVTATASELTNLSDNDWTFDLWAMPTSLGGTLLSIGTGSSALLQLAVSSDGTYLVFTLNTDIGDQTGTSQLAPVVAIAVNEWHFYSIQRSGILVKVFMDGTMIGKNVIGSMEAGAPQAFMNDTNNILGIGCESSPSDATCFTGYITNVRQSTGALYTSANFTPPTDSLQQAEGTNLLMDAFTNAPFADSAQTLSDLTISAGRASGSMFTPYGSSAPCFCSGTRLLRADGTVTTVEALRQGDLVCTGDGRAVAVVRVSSFSREVAPRAWVPIALTPIAAGSAEAVADAGSKGDAGAEVVLSPGHAVWEPKARGFRLAASYVDAVDMEQRSWTGRRCIEVLGKPLTYWHVQLPDFATDSLVVAGGMITEALDGGSTFEPEHKRGSGWVKSGIHPLQRRVRMFASKESQAAVRDETAAEAAMSEVDMPVAVSPAC